MRRPDQAACALVVIFAATVSLAGVAPPDPNEVKEFREGVDIFGLRLPDKPYDGQLARCPVCSKPYAHHVDPKFVCQPPDRHVKSVDTRQGLCPVCGHGFEASVPAANPLGGMDRDFCRHPRGAVVRATNVWTCSRCGYSAFHWEFNRPVDKETKSFVDEKITPATVDYLRRLAGLRPNLGRLEELESKKLKKFLRLDDFSFLDQSSLPEDLKYENAVAIYLRRGAPHRVLGKLYLEASHAYRRLTNSPVTAVGIDRSIRRVERLLVEGQVDSKDPAAVARAATRMLRRADSPKATGSERLTNRDRLLLHIRLAGLYDRLVGVWGAGRHFQDAERLAAGDPDKRARQSLLGLVRWRAQHLERETHHLTRAAAEFRLALAGGEITAEDERLLTTYLVGELLARTSEIARAVPWLEATVALAEGARAAVPGKREQGAMLAAWARERLESPAFREEGGGSVAADADEKVFVKELRARSSGRAREPVAGIPAAEAAPAQKPEQEPAPAGAAGSRAPKGRAPASCREQLTNLWKAIATYREARGEFPPDFKSLTAASSGQRRRPDQAAELVTGEGRGEFVCVESGHRLFYRLPPPGAGNTFIVYHADPTSCACKNVLYSDGAVRELGR